MRRSAVIASLVALAAYWGRMLQLQGSLPHSIPLHFDLAGRPDAWGPPTFGHWLLLPCIATAMTALFVGIGFGLQKLARDAPDWINLPRKARFVALPPEARVRVTAPLRRLVWMLPLAFIATMWVISEASAQIALDRGGTLPWTPVMVPVAVVLAWTAWGSVSAARAIAREEAALIHLGRVRTP